jgi:hypothetical protein
MRVGETSARRAEVLAVNLCTARVPVCALPNPGNPDWPEPIAPPFASEQTRLRHLGYRGGTREPEQPRMAAMEQLEMDAYRVVLKADLRALVEKYRAIFDWDIPGVDQADSDRLIIEALRTSLDEVGADTGPRVAT